MERSILALSICTSLVTALFNVTRLENGDYFVWSGHGYDCDKFSHGTCWRYLDRDDACECDTSLLSNQRTFSTLSHRCESFTYAGMDEGKKLYKTILHWGGLQWYLQ